jgi:nitrogen fixation protein NifB
MIDLAKHPCFNVEAKHEYARVHLPVAPKCNIQCNYCNRKFDCVNESRPGVTSAVLKPHQALSYLQELHKELPEISVVGIAGPGDPFANPKETLETLSLVRENFPDMMLCVSTNGLELEPYIDALAQLNVSHVTITINSLDIEVLSKIYSWVRYGKKVYRGMQAAEILLEKQLKCIKLLKEKGIMVKINSIVLPGINDNVLEELAKEVALRGADLMNCIPVVSNEETPFATIEEPDKKMMARVRLLTGKYLKPMTHCARCRADAAGLLGKDYNRSHEMLQIAAEKELVISSDRPYVAVSTYEGMLVNQHLGEAKSFYLFEETKNGYKLIELRKAPASGTGDFRWEELSTILDDCRAILTGGAGNRPTEILEKSGIKVVQMTGLIDTGLDYIFKQKPLRTLKKADMFKCGESCKGNAQGCA